MVAPLEPTPPIRLPFPPQVRVRPRWNLGPRLRGLGILTPGQRWLVAGAIGALFIGGILWLHNK